MPSLFWRAIRGSSQWIASCEMLLNARSPGLPVVSHPVAETEFKVACANGLQYVSNVSDQGLGLISD